MIWRGSPRPSLPDEIVCDEHNAFAFRLAMESIRNDTSLIFRGSVGTGKTTLMAEIDFWTEVSTDPEKFYGRDLVRVDYKINAWTSAVEFIENCQRWYDFTAEEKRGRRSPMELASRALRLFLDDLGVEREVKGSDGGPGYAVLTLVSLLSARHDAQLGTWITTNLSASELARKYGERIMSRLFSTNRIARLDGGDRRKIVAQAQALA
jgi:DNA replication protein DnaC